MSSVGVTQHELLSRGQELAKAGQIEPAIATFLRLRELTPNSFEPSLWLSMLYRRAGRPAESVRMAEAAVKLQPAEPNLLSNLGLSRMAAQSYASAAIAFQRAIQMGQASPQNYHQLGMSLQLQGRDVEAVEAFRHATRLAPNAIESWLALGQSLTSQNEPEAVKKAAKRALELDPNSARAHLTMAGALITENRTSEAEEHIRRAIQIDPQESTSHALLGLRQQSLGQMEEAQASFRRSVELQPKQGFAYCALMRAHSATDEDAPLLKTMEALAEDPTIAIRGQSFLHYGLGKAFEDLKQFGAAMAHFDEANRFAYQLKFGDRTFDSKAYAQLISRTAETFDARSFRRSAGLGSTSDTPIFIIGMMRSGTTLIEQILSSHRDVEAAGEQRFWMAQGHRAFEPGVTKSDSSRLRELALRYEELVSSVAPNAKHITDKMPDNYLMAGLIHMALPNARFIHATRNAADTCISIYSTPNPANIEWNHNKANIAFAYRSYLRLMEHWIEVIPQDRLLTVRYEDLVSDPEPHTRRIVEFCGLDWDEACLRPQDNARSVITPSVWQVRQPVYRSSVGRWRAYEPWLGAFGELANIS